MDSPWTNNDDDSMTYNKITVSTIKSGDDL